jgi:hypothetical protein
MNEPMLQAWAVGCGAPAICSSFVPHRTSYVGSQAAHQRAVHQRQRVDSLQNSCTAPRTRCSAGFEPIPVTLRTGSDPLLRVSVMGSQSIEQRVLGQQYSWQNIKPLQLLPATQLTNDLLAALCQTAAPHQGV